MIEISLVNNQTVHSNFFRGPAITEKYLKST